MSWPELVSALEPGQAARGTLAAHKVHKIRNTSSRSCCVRLKMELLETGQSDHSKVSVPLDSFRCPSGRVTQVWCLDADSLYACSIAWPASGSRF